MVQRGLVHIYTGSGKGKTTAAMGLCFRAAGWGIRSAVIQFMKGQQTGEMFAAVKLKEMILFEQFGSPIFLTGRDKPEFREHLIHAEKGLVRARDVLTSDRYSIVVLDELVSLPGYGLLPESVIIDLIKLKPPAVELVLTGRGASQKLIDLADLVTEMTEVKHYFSSGIIARKGIEY